MAADARAQMELTVMVQTLRPLALAPLRRALGYRMGLAMRGLPIKGEEDPDRVRLDSLKATRCNVQSDFVELFLPGWLPSVVQIRSQAKSAHHWVELKRSDSEAAAIQSIANTAEPVEKAILSLSIGRPAVRWSCMSERVESTCAEPQLM